ncbi:DNA polymerase III subunit beta [Candidatus Dependentiae bacterium]|nr:DNA polymerase III subunit beta [Candidatus Dependentiae bacterium]
MENKFIVDQKLLLSLLLSMQPICTKRTALDATSSILFQVGHKELVLKSTDLEISLQASCQLMESDVDKNCSFLVSGRRIFDVVKELEGQISCVLTSTQLSLQAGEVFLSLNIQDAQEFPPFPERIENLMQLDAPLLLKMVDSVGFLIPQNNGNPALNGLLLELSPDFLKMTTTDGHSLAQVSTAKATFNEPRTWLLPRRAIFELKKILEMVQDKTLFLGMCGNQLVFSGELFNFFTRILVDQFPDYKAILSKDEFVPATIDRSRLLKTLRRSTCLLLANQFVPTKFSFARGNVRVSMTNKEVGTLDEQLPVTGSVPKQVVMYLYAPFLLHGIQAFHDNDLAFYVKSGVNPIFFESHSDDFSMTYLVMPVSPTVARHDFEGIS